MDLTSLFSPSLRAVRLDFTRRTRNTSLPSLRAVRLDFTRRTRTPHSPHSHKHQLGNRKDPRGALIRPVQLDHVGVVADDALNRNQETVGQHHDITGQWSLALLILTASWSITPRLPSA